MVHMFMIHMAVAWAPATRVLTNGHHPHHARAHVIEQVAVERPISWCVGSDVYRQFLARLDDNGVLARLVGMFGGQPCNRIIPYIFQ